METNELVKHNRLLQRKLNAENARYYGDLLLYLRGKSVFKDDQIIEEKALEILQDILDAQSVGQSAETYFGQNPKVVADDLLANVPVNPRSFLQLAFYGISAYIIVTLFILTFGSSNVVDLGQFVVVGIYGLIGALGILWILGSSAYKKYNSQSRILNGFIFALYIVAGLTLTVFVKTPFRLVLSDNFILGIIVTIVALIAGSLFISKQKQK